MRRVRFAVLAVSIAVVAAASPVARATPKSAEPQGCIAVNPPVGTYTTQCAFTTAHSGDIGLSVDAYQWVVTVSRHGRQVGSVDDYASCFGMWKGDPWPELVLGPLCKLPVQKGDLIRVSLASRGQITASEEECAVLWRGGLLGPDTIGDFCP
jgi:hypothetical protein